MLKDLSNVPVVFLDIDGVLNNIACPSEKDFTQESIDVLNELYEKFYIKIVLSTSWKEAYVFSELVEFLHGKGIKAPIIDKTPQYIGEHAEYERDHEILSFIRTHNVKKYVILDDWMLKDPELAAHQVLTCYYDEKAGGLRACHKDEICGILSK